MRQELEAEGRPIYVVAVNKADAVPMQSELTDACRFPVLQDTDAVGLWTTMGGGKDDLYVFNAEGRLATYLPAKGETSTNLSTDEGYAAVKAAISDALP